MSKTNGTEETVDTAYRKDLSGNAHMFAFDTGGTVGKPFESGDFSLTSMAAAWFLRAEVGAWQEYTKTASDGMNFTADALGGALYDMRLDMPDLAALRNLLATAIGNIDSQYSEKQAEYAKAEEARKHSLNVVPEEAGIA